MSVEQHHISSRVSYLSVCYVPAECLVYSADERSFGYPTHRRDVMPPHILLTKMGEGGMVVADAGWLALSLTPIAFLISGLKYV
jgi:hypothetical protein